MSKAARSDREHFTKDSHLPFEEFSLENVDQLVHQLEKTRPKHAIVEVTPMKDSLHSPCLQEMTAIIVHDIGKAQESPQIYELYQYCPACKLAVKVP